MNYMVNDMMYCSKKCAPEGKVKKVNYKQFVEKEAVKAGMTVEDYIFEYGLPYGELCPVCDEEYQGLNEI